MAGESEELEGLETLAEQLAVAQAVNFTARLGREFVRLHHSSDLLINRSLIENIPNPVLEPLASEVALVSTNLGGVPYIVYDREHVLQVPSGYAESMASATESLLQDDVLRQRLI